MNKTRTDVTGAAAASTAAVGTGPVAVVLMTKLTQWAVIRNGAPTKGAGQGGAASVVAAAARGALSAVANAATLGGAVDSH